MTFLTYIEDSVDIHFAPSVQYPLLGRPGDEIVLDDLHANTLKLIYSLSRFNVVCGMTSDKYDMLVGICTKKAADLTKSDLHEFNAILNSFPYNKSVTVNVLGNDLAGTSDGCNVLTMLVIKILMRNQVRIKISLSNRSCKIIEACELKTGFDSSMSGVHEIIQNGLMTKEEILALYNDFYKNALHVNSRIFDTSPEGEPIVYLLNHAGIDLTNIRRQTEYLINTPLPDDPTLNEFNQTLDEIDKTFRAILAGNLVNQLRDPNRESSDSIRYPFEAPIKDEQNENLDLREKQKDFRLRYIHSIGQTSRVEANAFALVSELGKTKDSHIGKYVVGYKTHHNLPSDIVEKYEFQRGSEVKIPHPVMKQIQFDFTNISANEIEQLGSKDNVCAEATNSRENTGRSVNEPLSRKGRAIFFTNANGSPEYCPFKVEEIYQSPDYVTNEFTRQIKTPQESSIPDSNAYIPSAEPTRQFKTPKEALRLDANACLSSSLGTNTSQDSLQSTAREKNQLRSGAGMIPSKTLFGSPMISFYDDVVTGSEPLSDGVCFYLAVEHKGP